MNWILCFLYFYLASVSMCYCCDNFHDEINNEINSVQIVNDAHDELYATVYELQLFLSEQNYKQNISMSSRNNASTYINWLQCQYIKMADLLWSEIEYHLNDGTIDSEKFDLLEMIRVSHGIFLTGNFHENAIDLNLLNPYDQILFDCIFKINSTVDIAKQTYLTNEHLLQNELKVLLLVQDHFELKKILDDIYELFTTNVKYFEEVS